MTELALEVKAPSPIELIRQALSTGTPPEVIRELVALQQSMVRFEWEREERQMNIDFNAALSKVQEKVAFVNYNADGNKGSRYSTFESLDRALRPAYLAEGFSVSFDSKEGPQPNLILVICHLSREAITRDFTIPIMVDGSGPKGGGVMTGSQASVAAFSYGCRALLRRIFNVRTGEEDRDGGASEPNPKIVDLIEVIRNAETLADAKEAYAKAFALAREEPDGNRATIAVIDAFEKAKKEFAGRPK
jgi:hypothetical protein